MYLAKLTFLCILLPLLLLLGALPLIQGLRGDAVEAKLKEHLSSISGVSQAQIRKWWYETEAKRRGFPRVFPWCFSSKAPYKFPPSLDSKFHAPISTRNERAFDPQRFTWEGYQSIVKNTTEPHLKTIEVRGIEIKRSRPNSKVFGGAEGAKYFLLEQWAVFQLEMEQIEYLYVQSIGGPLGLPVGEFNKDFVCTEGSAKDPPDYDSITKVVPCHFAPDSAYKWPNVFTVVSPGKPVPKIQFRFRWTESQCHETGFFQFLFLAIDKLNHTHTVLSPIFRTKLDSESAIPSPYHPYHDMVNCDVPAKGRIEKFPGIIRILPNKEFDDCLVGGSAMKNGLNRDKCAPGPFSCAAEVAGSAGWNSMKTWKDQTDKFFNELVQKPGLNCCEPFNPMDSTPTTPPSPPAPTGPSTTEHPLKKQQRDQEKYFKDQTIKYELIDKITHGDYCVLVWLIFVPTADILARFFKDFPEIKHCGLGCWIIAHIALHNLGWLLVWWSLGLIIGGTTQKLGTVSVQHFIAGIIASFLQHVQFLTGLKRTAKEPTTFNWVLTHSLCGYLSHLVGYVTVLFSTAGAVRKWISSGLLMMWVAGVVALYFAERKQDQLLEVVLHRAQCPVLQRIVIDGGRPPMAKTKIGIVVGLLIGKLGLYVYLLMAHSAEKEARIKLEAAGYFLAPDNESHIYP